MRGLRNVSLIVMYFAWSSVMVWMFEPPSHEWSPELVSATGTFLGVTGTTFVGMILGRAANKWAETKGGSGGQA